MMSSKILDCTKDDLGLYETSNECVTNAAPCKVVDASPFDCAFERLFDIDNRPIVVPV
jgi:hypothetical protein